MKHVCQYFEDRWIPVNGASRTFRADAEFATRELKALLAKHRIQSEWLPARRKEKNPHVERKHREIRNYARQLTPPSGSPAANVVRANIYANIAYGARIISPYEAWTGHSPTLEKNARGLPLVNELLLEQERRRRVHDFISKSLRQRNWSLLEVFPGDRVVYVIRHGDKFEWKEGEVGAADAKSVTLLPLRLGLRAPVVAREDVVYREPPAIREEERELVVPQTQRHRSHEGGEEPTRLPRFRTNSEVGERIEQERRDLEPPSPAPDRPPNLPPTLRPLTPEPITADSWAGQDPYLDQHLEPGGAPYDLEPDSPWEQHPDDRTLELGAAQDTQVPAGPPPPSTPDDDQWGEDRSSSDEVHDGQSLEAMPPSKTPTMPPSPEQPPPQTPEQRTPPPTPRANPRRIPPNAPRRSERRRIPRTLYLPSGTLCSTLAFETTESPHLEKLGRKYGFGNNFNYRAALNSGAPSWLLAQATANEMDKWKGAYRRVLRSTVPRSANVIGAHQLFQVKQTDTTKKLKSRLVLWGHHDKDRDRIRTDARTPPLEALRFLFIIATVLNEDCRAADAIAAFMQSGKIQRSVFVRPPRELEPDPAYLWELLLLPYGLADAPRQWQLHSDEILR